jgi:hypothetical protein
MAEAKAKRGVELNKVRRGERSPSDTRVAFCDYALRWIRDRIQAGPLRTSRRVKRPGATPAVRAAAEPPGKSERFGVALGAQARDPAVALVLPASV